MRKYCQAFLCWQVAEVEMLEAVGTERLQAGIEEDETVGGYAVAG